MANVESALFFETPGELYARIFQRVSPAMPLPEISVEYRRFTGAHSTIRLTQGRLTVRIADLLQTAPAPVAEALAVLLVSKLFRKAVPAIYQQRYRLWLDRHDVRRAIHLVRQTRGRKQMAGPEGKRFNLVELFEQLNQKYFGGMMARPVVGWGLRASRTRLGHYDPSHNAIVLSPLLDSPAAPALAVEYVLFHEMLHLRFPEKRSGGRRCIHTKEFHNAEKQFVEFREAKRVLKEFLSRDLS